MGHITISHYSAATGDQGPTLAAATLQTCTSASGPPQARYSTVQCSTVQRPSSGQVQYSTVQYSTVQRPSSGSARAANDPSVFTIMKKAPSNRAFSWLRAPSSPFTFEDMIKIKHLKMVSRRKNKCPYCVLNEKALERAFSVIMKTDGSFAALPQTEYK